MKRDYYPIFEGKRLEYRHTSSEFEGFAKMEVEVSNVSQEGDTAKATLRVVRTLGQSVRELTYAVTKNQDGVFLEDEPGRTRIKELEFPLEAGRRWSDGGGNENAVASLSETVSVPAGTFENCLRIDFLIAGGDSGSGKRFYAPGTGLVKEERTAEDAIEKIVLFSLPHKARKRGR